MQTTDRALKASSWLTDWAYNLCYGECTNGYATQSSIADLNYTVKTKKGKKIKNPIPETGSAIQTKGNALATYRAGLTRQVHATSTRNSGGSKPLYNGPINQDYLKRVDEALRVGMSEDMYKNAFAYYLHPDHSVRRIAEIAGTSKSAVDRAKQKSIKLIVKII